MPDFLPRRHHDLADWLRNAAEAFVESPQTYRLTPERAAAFAEQVAGYRSLLARTLVPGTRTAVSVRAALDARAEVTSEARSLVGMCRHELDGAQLVRIGLRPRSLNRRRLPGPTAPAGLRLLKLTSEAVELVAFDPSASWRAAKPRRAAGVWVKLALPDRAHLPPDQWHHLGGSGRTRVRLALPTDLPPGTPLRFAACWISPTCEAGPFGDALGVELPRLGLSLVAA